MPALKRSRPSNHDTPQLSWKISGEPCRNQSGQRCQVHHSHNAEHDNVGSMLLRKKVPPSKTAGQQAVAAKPLTSADIFTNNFLTWCDNAGIHGRIDLTILVIAAEEFAEYSGVSMISRMALSKALARRGIKKIVKDLAKFETKFGKTQYDRSKRRNHVLRPRVTVYDLPSCNEGSPNRSRQQPDLFSND
jgi:hypothetical protein